MPSPEKDRQSGRVGRLLAALRPSRAGPLPVQTGFPTSLADLVVKNHGRLRKQPSPSSKRSRKGGGASSASPSPSPPPSPPPPPPPAVSPSDRPRPDLSPARRDKSVGGSGLGLGFLAASGVVSLALLVIWSKKVVAAVTVVSFSLFLLESLRCRSSSNPRPRPRRAATTETQLYLDGRGRVSPIREVEAEVEPEPEPSRRLSCSESERGGVEEAAEEKNPSGVPIDESSAGSKAKRRSWKKLIARARKLHRGRKGKEEAGEDRWGSFRSEGDATLRGHVVGTEDSSSCSLRGGGGSVASETDGISAEPDSLGSSRRRSSEIVRVISPMEMEIGLAKQQQEEEEVEEEEVEQQGSAGIRLPALLLVAVVLAGLVAGKLPAVAFTMLCAAFFSSVDPSRFPCCRGDGSRRRRLEVPVSAVSVVAGGENPCK